MTPLMWLATTVFILAFVLISTEKINKTITAVLGGCFFILVHLVEGETVLGMIDWNVIFVLIGLMLIIAVTKRSGLFQYVAVMAAKAARGEPYLILILLNLVTAGFSTILDNVTTVLILVPVALFLASELDIKAAPFVITMAIASNIGGSATLIGDPPNIMIGSQSGLTFLDFLDVNLVIVVLILAVYCLGLKLVFQHRLPVTAERKARIMAFDEAQSITDRPLLVKSLVVLTAVVVGMMLHGPLGVPPATVALTGGFLLVLLADRHKIDQFLQEIEWGTIFFFIGLFIMVEGLVALGVIKVLADSFIAFTGGDILLTTILLVWFAGILSAFVDNIPFVATMAPLIISMGQTLGPQEVVPLWWALSLGACLGGNGTLIGASANVVSVGLARKAGLVITFKDFALYGVPVTLMALVLSTLYLAVRFFVF